MTPAGYVDGMGLYNGYFAERFALDPSGLTAEDDDCPICPEEAKTRTSASGGIEYRTEIHDIGTQITTNGCSSSPDYPFLSAYNTHDRYYSICGNDRSACDNSFLDDMEDACKELFPFHSLILPENRRGYLSCISSAQGYYDRYQSGWRRTF